MDTVRALLFRLDELFGLWEENVDGANGEKEAPAPAQKRIL